MRKPEGTKEVDILRDREGIVLAVGTTCVSSRILAPLCQV